MNHGRHDDLIDGYDDGYHPWISSVDIILDDVDDVDDDTTVLHMEYIKCSSKMI